MSTSFQIRIEPRDLLFCRDARPMEGSWTGHGGRWPLGATLHGAILAALQQSLNIEPGTLSVLSSLCTLGPFPEKVTGDNTGIYFPTPLDILPDGEVLRPAVPYGKGNLPAPLTKVLKNPSKPTKDEVPPWISGARLLEYLRTGKPKASIEPVELFTTETRPGIAIDPKSRCVVDGKFYTAEYLRLQSDTALAAVVRLNDAELLRQALSAPRMTCLFGGQQCCVHISNIRTPDGLLGDKILPDELGCRVKWVLLTPAYWDDGWLPYFVAPDGRVMLKAGTTERRPDESRDEWRARKAAQPSIDARLVAARVGNAQTVSGWRMATAKKPGGPRATRLLVPAGSVYYFETSSPEESRKLIDALTRKCMTRFGGDCGYGFGVCSTYQE